MSAALVLALMLGACALPSPQAGQGIGMPADMRQDITGRISVVTGEPPEQKNLYGGFRLELLSGERGKFDVFTPLGQMVVQASWAPGFARLDDGRQTRNYSSFEAMTSAGLGLALPRVALQDWVRGEPASSLPFTRLADGAFEQLGWRVHPRFASGRLHILRASRLHGEAAQLSLVIDAEQSVSPVTPGAKSLTMPQAPASLPK